MGALNDNQKREVLALGVSSFMELGNWLLDGGNATDQLSGFFMLDGGTATSTSFLVIDGGQS